MYLMIILRLLHIIAGMLWVGMMAFTVVFLMPALRDAGPDGGRVMAALRRRGLTIVMPVLALATLLSGMALFHRLAGGDVVALLRTHVGIAFASGGIAALFAFLLGVVVLRPMVQRAAALAQSPLGAAGEQAAATRAAELERLRLRGAAVSRLIVLLLIAAAAAMAVARYV